MRKQKEKNKLEQSFIKKNVITFREMTGTISL